MRRIITGWLVLSGLLICLGHHAMAAPTYTLPLPLPPGSLLVECESLPVSNWHPYSDPEASGGTKLLANDPTWIVSGEVDLPLPQYTVWVRSVSNGHYPGHYHYNLTINEQSRTMAVTEPLGHVWVWERWGEISGGRHTLRLDNADSFPAQADCLLFTPDASYRPSGRPFVELQARVPTELPRTGATCELHLKPQSIISDQKLFCALRRDGKVFWTSEITLPKPASQWQVGETIVVPINLPAFKFIAPGKLTFSAELSGCEWVGHEEGDYTVAELNLGAWQAAPPCTASIRRHNGTPTLFVGDKSFFGFAFLGVSTQCYPEFAEAGGHIYSIGAGIGNSASDTFNSEEADTPYQYVLDADPDALILPRIGVTAPKWWLEANPDERVVFDDGSVGPQSMASEKWLEQVGKDLAQYVRHTRNSPYADRVIGYHFETGESSEWQAWGLWGDHKGDFSIPMCNAFIKWLKTRYTTNEALQKAWGDTQVTFDTVTIPKVPERWTSGRILLDPLTSQRIIDFYEFYPTVTVKAINYFAKIIKEASDHKALAGVFYGYAPQYGPIATESQHLGVADVLASEDIDFLCSPAMYSDRGPGGTSNFMSMTDSVQLHHKYWFDEADIRTHLQPDVVGRCADMPQTLGVLKREYGNVRAQGAGMWWFDMSGGWFSAPEISQLFTAMQNSGDASLKNNKCPEFAPEVGVFYDEKSAFRQQTSASGFYHYAVTMQIASLKRIGAPTALHLLSDINSVPDYKVYVFLNAYDLTAEQRKSINRLKRDGKMLVFIYAAGFGRVDKQGMVIEDITGMRELIGLDISIDPVAGPLRAQIVSDERLCVNPVLREEYGGKEDTFGAEGDISPRFLPAEQNATVLARTADEQAAMVIREMDDWTVVYSAAPGIPPGLLHNLCKKAGVHLFTKAGDALYAGRGTATLHATKSGRKTIQFPGEFDVCEILGAERKWQNVRHITLEMAAMETIVLEVK